MHYFIDPFGCVKNQVDAETMMAYLNNAGWKNVSDAETADLIIINSCGFIESAKQESINAVLEWRKLYPAKKILLAGCLSQRYANELPDILTEADTFMGVENLGLIVEKAGAVLTADSGGVPHITNSLPIGERPLLSLPGSAYVKISEGCNNNCSYCAIPLIRGGLVCREISDIADECRALLGRGVLELNIIGQDIGGFEKLPELLNRISEIEGDFWVRLLYIHPNHFPLEILNLLEKDKRFLPYFDIPFQHASAKILSAMNRNSKDVPKGKTQAEKYLELIKTIRTRLPDAVIRSTFLLGFPGEDEKDFNELLEFQQKAELDWLGCFVYSREEGTASYSMKKRVAAKTAEARKQTIEERQISITEKNLKRFIGQTLNVLIEEKIDAPENGEDIWLGRLYCQAPDIDGAAVVVGANDGGLQLGSFAKCKVIARRGFDLEVHHYR